MSIEANKAIVLRYFTESHNAPYNLGVIDETCSPAFAESNKRWMTMENSAFPDKQFAIDDVLAEGDKVLLRWTMHGTHRGAFWTPKGTVLPTGNTLNVTSMALYRLMDGKIVEAWGVHDWLTVLTQLGAEIRLPEQPKKG